jgi:hypothetical protein
MEITAHEQPVSFYGSSQVGYIILDPQTGAGAYKIGGGENGGEIFLSALVGFMSFIELLFGVAESDTRNPAARAFSKIIKSVLGSVVTVINILIGVMDLLKNCKGAAMLQAIAIYIFLAVAMAAFVTQLGLFVATAGASGILGFLVMHSMMNGFGLLLNIALNDLKKTCD